jgi:uncharacterized protein
MSARPSLSQPQYRIVVERNVPAKMRDGIMLYADVHRPDAAGPCPVLVMRVPYDKTAATPLNYVNYFVPRGYVVVVQDTRGRYTSEGEYYPLIHEAADGYDTVEWAAMLTGSNGKVGTAGQSYHGATQYLLPHTCPPHLVCQVPISASANFHASWVYHTGGVFEFGWQVAYTIFMARNTAERQKLGPAYLQQLDQYVAPGINFAQPLQDEWYRHLPLKDWADWLRDTAPYFADYLKHPDAGPYWQPVNLYQHHQNIRTPMYHIGSWYDVFQEGTLGNFTGILRHGGPEARTTQKLLMGPWGHLLPYAVPTTRGTGEIDFGPDAAVDVHAIELRWFDHWLKGIDTGLMREPPIKIFVMGDNAWREEQEWPLARTQYTRYYFHSQGAANSLHGNGRLSLDEPAQEPPDTYVYDPRDPVPTRGGNALVIPMGVYDQRPVEERRAMSCAIPAIRSRAHWRSSAQSRSRCMPHHPHPIRISPPSSLTCAPMVMPRIWRTALSAHATANLGPILAPSCRAWSTNTPSICGPPAWCANRGIASVLRSPAPTSHASTAIRTPGIPSSVMPSCRPRRRRFSMTRCGLRTSCYQ